MYICPKCGFEIKTSREKHFNSCDGKGPRRRQPKKGYNPWNKGLSKENDERIKKYGKLNSDRIKSGETIPYFKGKQLSEEHKEKLRKRKKSGIDRRSKNEIYFAKLCKEYFKNVKTNEKIFNGWDADVIIEDIKTAVLWNGRWHYEKIMEGHSLEQVQNRDRIKLNEIKKAGYTPYIIKDMGKHDPDFVKEKFEEFLKSTSIA